MRLIGIDIEGYRGLPRLRLGLGRQRVLIGENGWGKHSLFAALQQLLGVHQEPRDALAVHDFHDPRHDPSQQRDLAIRLTLRELADDSWDVERFAPLQQAIHRSPEGRRITIALHGRRRDGQVASWLAVEDAQGAPLPQVDPALVLAELASFCPVLRLGDLPSGGRLDDLICDLPDPEAQDQRQRLEAQVREVSSILSATPHRVGPDDLTVAQEALRSLLEAFLGRSGETPPGRRRVSDMVAAPHNLRLLRDLRDLVGDGSTSAQQILALLILGGILSARGCKPLREGAAPLLIVDDLEAHLHPVALATAWTLIDRMPGQKLITTNSGTLLGNFPLTQIKRLLRDPEQITSRGLDSGSMATDDLRRLAFHLRVHRPESLFARCWLLVEGETEFWLLPELAAQTGLHFPTPGIQCVEFAQCGLDLLIRCAQQLGVAWHVVSDGDRAGAYYRSIAERHIEPGVAASRHLTVFEGRDIEHYLWHHGFEDSYRRAAGQNAATGKTRGRSGENPSRVIERAIKAVPKPQLALQVAEEAGRRGLEAVPAELRQCFGQLAMLSSY
jgi:putative ATP-dependent endonuclease of OLD family